MRSVYQLTENVNLGKLIQAQRYLIKASALFDEVFAEEGAPNEYEAEQEGFYDSLAGCQKKIEHLIGAVVYHDLFVE